MDPIKMTEFTKKYGSAFLMWCAIAFLYTELSATKEDLKEVQGKLYSCLEIRANTSQHLNTNHRMPFRELADLPKKQRYALKGIKGSLEV
jgi:hypothetical protein